jgi:hypothetical protein
MALAGALEEWLKQGAGPLTLEGGWRHGAPVSSSELWATIVSLAVDASGAVARFSEASRYPEVRLRETVERRTDDARVMIRRLAAAALLELEDYVDADELLAAADGLVDEIDDEDDALMHAGGAIASLLRARLLCTEEEVELPSSELASAAIEILAPLLAQYACLLTRGYAAERRVIVACSPPTAGAHALVLPSWLAPFRNTLSAWRSTTRRVCTVSWTRTSITPSTMRLPSTPATIPTVGWTSGLIAPATSSRWSSSRPSRTPSSESTRWRCGPSTGGCSSHD